MEHNRLCWESESESEFAEIPEDLQIYILLRMPVKSVIKCRCLSKFFRDLIYSAEFTRRYYDLSIQTRPKVLVHLIGNLLLGIDCVAKVHQLVKLEMKGEFEFCGCSMGITCFESSYPEPLLLFWNPATGAARISYAEHAGDIYKDTHVNSKVYSGRILGYDDATDELKLLRILANDEEDEHSYICFIFSPRTNSWRRIEGFSRELKMRNRLGSAEVFVEASSRVHMIVNDELGNAKVLGFDFAAEKFNLVPLPADCRDISAVSVVDGCLCLYKKSVEFCFDVWMMKEYGVRESWTCVFTIRYSDSSSEFTAKLVPFQLVADNNGRRQLLMLSHDSNRPGLYMYDDDQESPQELMDTEADQQKPPHFLYAPTCRQP